MNVTATTRAARMAPQKVRDVARTLRGRQAVEAAEWLRFVPRKSAKLIEKTLRSALANAENNHNLSSDSLYIDTVIVEQGPAFRRFRPVARGSAHPYRKRTSHIRVTLTDEAPAAKGANSE